MNLDKLNRWLIPITNLGVIIGLVLVLLQLRQDEELMRAELYSDAATARMELHYQMMDPELARVVVKSWTEPETLTLEELRVMDSYLLAAINENRRRLALDRLGLSAEVGAPENTLLFYFGNRFAKAWWQQFKGDGGKMDAELRAIDATISVTDEEWTMDFFKRLRADLNTSSAE